jgi:hypothetical protein
MLESAPKEADVSDTPPSDEEKCDCANLVELAGKICDDTGDLTEGPMLHKVIALTIIKRLAYWHQKTGEIQWEEDSDMASAWIRDAGKLQAALQILESVSLGDEDFTCPDGEI